MSTVAQVINRVQRQLLSGTVEERNKLATSLTATATTVTFQYDLSGIRPGSVIQIDAELMYVWEVAVASKTATVERAFNGTTAATHATSSIVTLNPKFPRNQIFEALNDELADLSSPVHSLFRVKTYDFNYNAADRQSNLSIPDEIIDIIDVRYRYLSSDYKQVNQFKLLRNMPTKDFGSGIALQIDSQITSGSMRVVYKTHFTKVTQETDNVQMIAGFPESAEDILVMGCEIRLVAPREVKRNFTESQGDTRRPDEVPSGAVGNSLTNLIRMRRDRITAEAAKLNKLYPTFLNRV